MIGIYKITNPKGLPYIGQSANIESRIESYRRTSCKEQRKLYNSIKKYGWENHSVIVLIECEIHELNNYERYFILKYDSIQNGLNISDGRKYNRSMGGSIKTDGFGNIMITYVAKWQLKEKPQYKWTECGKLINTNTGRTIKKTLKGLTPGYWINKKFIPLRQMRTMVEKIPYSKLPF